MSQLYDEDMGDQSIDISASKRNTIFQTSIRVTQDPNKDGIISFLEDVERELPYAASQAPGTLGSTAGSGTSSGTTTSGDTSGGSMY